MLATVARTWGSAPRPVGSVVAVRDVDDLLDAPPVGGLAEDAARREEQPDALHARGGDGVRGGISSVVSASYEKPRARKRAAS